MSVVAETTTGRVEGFQKDGLNLFLGIPFAAPPVGEICCITPQPLQPWSGVNETKAWGPAAP